MSIKILNTEEYENGELKKKNYRIEFLSKRYLSKGDDYDYLEKMIILSEEEYAELVVKIIERHANNKH